MGPLPPLTIYSGIGSLDTIEEVFTRRDCSSRGSHSETLPWYSGSTERTRVYTEWTYICPLLLVFLGLKSLSFWLPVLKFLQLQYLKLSDILIMSKLHLFLYTIDVPHVSDLEYIP